MLNTRMALADKILMLLDGRTVSRKVSITHASELDYDQREQEDEDRCELFH